jgi:post-segregation antitoxin (ccd killing protein)
MRMARVNVYLPDELAREARSAGLNISSVAQEALSRTLAHGETNRWLDGLDRLPRIEISHARVMAAVGAARAELGDDASA